MRKLLDSPWFYFGLAGLLAVVALASQFRLGPKPKPTGTVEDIAALAQRDDLNVVFILVDTLRADHLGIYGYDRPTSPRLDEIARRGIRFSNVESQSSWTKASMASLWTGLYPARSGILRYDDGIPDAASLPAEIFKEAGFETAGIYRNSWLGANFGFGQGFDLYVKATPNFNIERLRNPSPSSGVLKGSDLDITESATEFMAANRENRFLLYLHYMDAHQYTYDTESDLFGSGFEAMYDNAIHWTDLNLDRIFRNLQAFGLHEKTIVVIASDHGEGFYEHGFEGHAKGLYSEVQFTPWIISLPFDLPEPLVVDAQVGNVDIWPTMLELVGLDPLPETDGRSAVPAILAAGRGEPVPEAFQGRTIFAQIDRHWGKVDLPEKPQISAVRAPYRLQHSVMTPNRDELFDHSTDPKEQENVARRNPEVAAELRAEIETYLEEGTPVWAPTNVELDELRLNQLRALGYKLD